jgi:hypothetical protein
MAMLPPRGGYAQVGSPSHIPQDAVGDSSNLTAHDAIDALIGNNSTQDTLTRTVMLLDRAMANILNLPGGATPGDIHGQYRN